MELVLIGPPGSGKSAVGRRIAARHGAAYVDLDDQIEATAGRPIPAIFEIEGEAGFRARERAAILTLGEPDSGPALTRVIAAGGGAILEARNRWRLFRGRRVIRLQAPAEILLRRLRGGPVRPLLAGPRPLAALRELIERRERFYAAGVPVNGAASEGRVVAAVESVLAADAQPGTTLLRAATPIGLVTLGEGDAGPALVRALGELGARRAAVVSEPTAWRLHGERLAARLDAAGIETTRILVPRGERAKTITAYESLVRELARNRLERGDPIVAIGGGALGDAAGFAAATYLRGVPLVHVPTTLVAQVDSAIGGKTALDIPEGKNLVGAFYQPRAVVVDVAHLVTLPARQVRAALGEAIKVAALGDERLFELLESEVSRLPTGIRAAVGSGALAEIVERCAWWKVGVVSGDERDHGARLTLNLGHSIGHAIEAAAGYRALLHGEAVAHGLRGAIAIGRRLGITPDERADRILALLDAAGLAQEPPGVTEEAVRAHMERDKKHADGMLRWVLPVESGVVVRSDVPDDAVGAGLAAALAGSRGTARSGPAGNAGHGRGGADGRDGTHRGPGEGARPTATAGAA